MTSIRDWSATAGSNTSVGGVSIAEGWSPADVNNAIRGLMAEIPDWRAVVEAALTSAGTADDQTITTAQSIGSYAVPLVVWFKAGSGLTNTGAFTVAIDGLAAKNVKLVDSSTPHAGAVTAAGVYGLAYEASADVLILLNPKESMSATSTTTLTNKTFDLTDNTLVGTLAELSSAISDATVASTAGTETLTNKTFDLTDNTLAGTLAELSSAISDATVASTAGTETLTNKTINGATLGATTLAGAITGAAQVVSNIEAKDWAETVNAMGSISGANDVDYTAGGWVTMTITGSTTLTITNPPASDKGGSLLLEITNGGSNVTVTNGEQSSSGGATMTLTTSGKDFVIASTRDAASTVTLTISTLDAG